MKIQNKHVINYYMENKLKKHKKKNIQHIKHKKKNNQKNY